MEVRQEGGGGGGAGVKAFSKRWYGSHSPNPYARLRSVHLPTFSIYR